MTGKHSGQKIWSCKLWYVIRSILAIGHVCVVVFFFFLCLAFVFRIMAAKLWANIVGTNTSAYFPIDRVVAFALVTEQRQGVQMEVFTQSSSQDGARDGRAWWTRADRAAALDGHTDVTRTRTWGPGRRTVALPPFWTRHQQRHSRRLTIVFPGAPLSARGCAHFACYRVNLVSLNTARAFFPFSTANCVCSHTRAH